MNQLKQLVSTHPQLTKIDYHSTRLITLAVDSFPTGAGWVLYQDGHDGHRRPVEYVLIAFTEEESRYSQPKRELCGLTKALKKTKYDLWGTHFRLEVDPTSLLQMVNNPNLPNAAMSRWLAYIKLFTFAMVHVPAVPDHVIPDALSRREREAEDDPAVDLDDLLEDEVQSQQNGRSSRAAEVANVALALPADEEGSSDAGIADIGENEASASKNDPAS